MKLLISWSGEQSKDIAEGLVELLKGIFAKNPDVWMSAHDISAGQRWADKLNNVLQESSFGVLCLTPDNFAAPWIMYEAGSLAKTVDASCVIPYLIGLTNKELDFPLAQFQAVEANPDGTFRLVESINSIRSPSLRSEDLKKSFVKWWPDLQKRLSKAPAIQRMVIVEVDELTENLKSILLRASVPPARPRHVRVLAADANELLFERLLPVMLDKAVNSVAFDFCIVDPAFAASNDVNEEFAARATQSLQRLSELRNDPLLKSRDVTVDGIYTYRYHPNTWGVLINDTDLFIGFHDWVGPQRLRGTQYGMIYLKKGDPLWERFSTLLTGWFEHGSEWKSTAPVA